jgi:hypothetical protein
MKIMLNPLSVLYVLRALFCGALSLLGVCMKPLFIHLQAAVNTVSETPMEIPVWVMQSFQIGAWSAAIFAGVFTCYGVYKTHHGKKKK